MYLLLIALISLLIATPILFLAQDLAGKPKITPHRDRRQLKTQTDLRSEYGDRLSTSVYDMFARAVEHQLEGRFQEALQDYDSLSRLRRSDGAAFNLMSESPSAKYNFAQLQIDLDRNPAYEALPQSTHQGKRGLLSKLAGRIGK